jgi:phosphopantothenoylcysteine decarboxylase / phosphopantothenate---cysteine ligase
VTAKALRGLKVLITAGPTREYWDPVRFLTNASSGTMGLAIAKQAAELGAHVVVVLGPIPESTAIPRHPKIKIVPVVSAWEMLESVKTHLRGTDIFVGAAAVVDYRPAEPMKLKIKRQKASVTLKLHGNPDIIAMVGHLQKGRPRSVVGFALETDHMEENAFQKLVRKRLDWIVANRETNMGSESGEVTLLSRWGDRISVGRAAKDQIAKKIWQTITPKI